MKSVLDPEIRETVERLLSARAGQGFGGRIEDSATLLRIAGIIAEPDKRNGHRSKPPVAVMSGGHLDRDNHSE